MKNQNNPAQTTEPIGAEVLLIGFTGSLGSGCTFISEGIKNILGDNCRYYRISSVLREEAKKRGKKKPTTSYLQDLGNELRTKKLDILAEKTLERIKKDAGDNPQLYNKDTIILLDGIRNDGEVRFFRQFPHFYLISVHASRETRKGRLVGDSPQHRFKNEKQFDIANKRDESEDVTYGQQVSRCNYLADIIIDNERAISIAAEAEVSSYIHSIIEKYIKPIQAVHQREEPAADRPPSIDETLMTMAYCISKKSSCLKRKVGTVIAYVESFEKLRGKDPREDSHIQFQVLSAGYNDVPLGTIACVFTSYKKCYRDYLKEEQAKKIRCCWNCGENIPKNILCPYCEKKNNPVRTTTCKKCGATLPTYKCAKCKTNVFEILIAGKEPSQSKFLDMCRSLHAEETAIISLAGINKAGKGELVLYTTTYPCNLCANKIVAAGIKRVIFAEPYTIKEAEKILGDAEVRVVKFQGIKSTAYFRLYS